MSVRHARVGAHWLPWQQDKGKYLGETDEQRGRLQKEIERIKDQMWQWMSARMPKSFW